MRAAGVCLATVAVMSGSLSANVSAAPSDSSQRLAADDFTITFSATPTRVVLGRDGRSAAEYRIVVRHPRSIDQLDYLTMRFAKGAPPYKYRRNNFKMRGAVVSEPSARRTVLSGHSQFLNKGKWVNLPANPGLYTALGATVSVTRGGESTAVKVAPPVARIRILHETETRLRAPSATGGRVILGGALLRYPSGSNGSAAVGKRLNVMFLRRGATEPRVVATPMTNRYGRFRVERQVHRPGRWWVSYSGGPHLDGSRSSGYEVSASK
jgi:hypothetical protein